MQVRRSEHLAITHPGALVRAAASINAMVREREILPGWSMSWDWKTLTVRYMASRWDLSLAADGSISVLA